MAKYKSEKLSNYMHQCISSHHYDCRFRYTTTFKEAFLRDGIATLQSLDDQGWVAGSDANVFVSNHDTERVRHISIFTLMDLTVITPGVEFHLPQCVLAFKHLHVGYRFLPVCSSTALCMSRDMSLTIEFLFVRAALIHTAHLLYCRATAISTTETLEDRTAVRLMHLFPLPPLS